MSKQSELLQRAADCDRLMRSASNMEGRELLRDMRDLWIALANNYELTATVRRSLQNEIAAIEKIQSTFAAMATSPALH